MAVKYDVPKYLASIRMSSKRRILVEGKDDKSHIKNLLDVKLGRHKIKVDTAENIKGNCRITAKNNRKKIEHIHKTCQSSPGHKNLYFLCDREFREFQLSDQVVDLMPEHKIEGNLSWTLGHSLENYFIEPALIADAYRYLTDSEYKSDAIKLFRKIFPSALIIIATISLAAKKIKKCSYPQGVIFWDHFTIDEGELRFDTDHWRADESNKTLDQFKLAYRNSKPILEASESGVHTRFCRGHTAMQLLQRVFSLCLFHAGCRHDQGIAEKCASNFSQLKESAISTALGEAWLKSIKAGSTNYPTHLISAVA